MSEEDFEEMLSNELCAAILAVGLPHKESVINQILDVMVNDEKINTLEAAIQVFNKRLN